MASHLWNRIEYVRGQPEYIRKRYVIGCLVVSMLFVFGLWTLTLKENFSGVTADFPKAVLQGKELLPDRNEAPSIDSILHQAQAPVIDKNNETTGAQLFNDQWQKRVTTGSEAVMSEGVGSPRE